MRSKLFAEGIRHVEPARDARGRPIMPPAKRRRNAQPEQVLQTQISNFLRVALPASCGIAWSSTLNGVKLATEAARRKAKEQGLNGGVVLDLCFIPLHGPKMGVTHWIEVKVKGNYPSPEQRVVLAAMEPVGLAVVCRSVPEVYDALVSWGFEPRARP